MAKKKRRPIRETGPAEPLQPDGSTRENHITCYFLRLLKTRGAGFVLIALHLLFGLFIVKDYGMSFDENYERETSLVTYNYVMKLENSKSEAVREFAQTIPAFDAYPEKHGTALHFPLVAIEHYFRFELPSRTVYLMRHIFVFLNYILAALCFYVIIWRRFPKTWLPILSVLLFIMYPRFFAESFYNNKDILFYSWYIISVCAILLWLEKPKISRTLLAGATLAFAANTRILAISVLLLAIVFFTAKAVLEKKKAIEAIIWLVSLVVVFLAIFIAITPHTWENPFTGIIGLFEHFLRFSPWDGKQLYLGEWITKDVPWHYIPVWIIITSPVLYIVLFILGNVAFVLAFARNKAKLRFLLCENMYDSFFIALFWLTLLGFIGLGIYMYNGWRHAYSIFCPLLFIAVYGLSSACEFFRQKHIPAIWYRIARYIATGSVAVSMIVTTVWLIRNHPYQYVYFNMLAASYAKENFDRDYWGVSGNDSLDYILENDSRENISISPPHPSTWYMLNKQDQSRTLWLENPLSWADFHFQPETTINHQYSPDYIVPYIHGNIIPDITGYQGIYDIESGGIVLSRLYRNLALDAFDERASENILDITGTVGNGNYSAMFDGSPDTYWSTNAPQKVGDYMQIEFRNPVQYNLIRMELGYHVFDYIMGRVLVSSDGKKWSEAEILWRNCVDFLIEAPSYRYLVIIIDEPDETYWWIISALRFGNIDPEIYLY